MSRTIATRAIDAPVETAVSAVADVRELSTALPQIGLWLALVAAYEFAFRKNVSVHGLQKLFLRRAGRQVQF